MTRERWQQIESLYHSAQGLAGPARAAYLERACAGDEELRAEVASLVRESARADGPLCGELPPRATGFSALLLLSLEGDGALPPGRD